MSVTASECRAIDRSGFDVFSLANNHAMDCGEAGLHFTLKYLRRAGILTVGGGVTRSEADACLYMNSQGKKVAFLAVTDASHYAAGRARPGVSSLNKQRYFKKGRSRQSVGRSCCGLNSLGSRIYQQTGTVEGAVVETACS